MLNKVLSLFLILTVICAIDCSVDELKPYYFESIQGIHNVIDIKDTPPSKTNITWYFGICETINEGVDKCPKNSDICGITTIILDKDQTVISEIIGFNSNLQKTYEPMDDDKGIKILYKGANWGDSLIDAELVFNCDKNGDDKFNLKNWDGKKLSVEINSKAGCKTKKDEKEKNPSKPSNGRDPKNDSGESWGWFTWIFIFMVLFLSIYIIGGAWFQYNRGNSIDFQSALKEVLENFLDILKGLPNFIKEIIEKVTGNNTRGEYSAV